MKATIFLISIGLMLIFFTGWKFFSIRKVEVRLDKINCADNVSLKNEITLVGENLFLIDEQNLKNRLKEKFFCIADVVFAKSLPNKVSLNILGRKPKLILMATPSGGIMVVDEEGVMLSEENLPGLAKIFVSGEKIEASDIKKIIQITDWLEVLGWEIKLVRIDEKRNLFVDSVYKVYFSLEKSVDHQLASLQLILNQAKIEKEKVEYIDLRFDNPVIKEL